MFGSKSDHWILMMMMIIIFGTLTMTTHGAIEPGTKTHGEACKNIHGECDFEKKLLMCIKEKCQCIESNFYGYPKKGTGPLDESTPAPAGNNSARTGNKPPPKPEKETHIPSGLEWNKEKDNCMVKKNNPCQLEYKDTDIFRTCGKGKCEKDSKSPQEDLGLCKGGKGAGEKDKDSGCEEESGINLFITIGLSFLTAFYFSID